MKRNRTASARPFARFSRAWSRAAAPIALAIATACSRSDAAPKHAVRARTAVRPSAASAPTSDTSVRDLDIAFYEARARRDSTGAADLAHVAALYLQRSRETGDPRDAVRAETAARRSVRNRPRRNAQAREVLAASLLTQHRFAEALAVARSLRDDNPDSAPLRAMLGEIEMELGQY